MTKPITLVTGIDQAAQSATVLSLMLDLPHPVVVRHRIDLERSVLVRMVSDITGIIEHQEIDLEHACVPCAVREDVVPTLERVARDERWGSVIVQLPVAAGADQVCAKLAQERNVLRALRISSVVAAVAGPGLEDDLLGDDLLPDRGLGTSPEDRRGVGEALADLIEFADACATSSCPRWTSTTSGGSTSAPTGASTPSGCSPVSSSSAPVGTAPRAASGCPPDRATPSSGPAPAARSASAPGRAGAGSPRTRVWSSSGSVRRPRTWPTRSSRCSCSPASSTCAPATRTASSPGWGRSATSPEAPEINPWSDESRPRPG